MHENASKRTTLLHKRLLEYNSALYQTTLLLKNNTPSLPILQESSFFTFFALLGCTIFENTHLNIDSLKNAYKVYSLSHIRLNTHSTYSLWKTFWDNFLLFDTKAHSFHIPVLSFQYFTPEIRSIIQNTSVKNSDFIHLIDSIYSIFIDYSLTITDLGSLYESLISLSLTYDDTQTILFTENIIQKTSASYYTPTILAQFLVKEAIDNSTDPPEMLSLIDISCGAGSILLQALHYLTQKISPEAEAHIVNSCNTSKNKECFEEYKNIYVKRYFIQHSLYGIDTNYFALSLCHYTLAIEGFIPFEEALNLTNTIKCGNALFGISYDTAIALLKSDEQKETLKTLFIHFKNAIQNKNDSATQYKALLQQQFDALLYTHYLDKYVQEHSLHAMTEQLMQTTFHYELEFPDVFLTERTAFSTLIGNPPWDKMKLENALFFGQFYPSYGTLLNSKKQDILKKEKGIKIKQKSDILSLYALTNHYYKQRYPLSRGSGDDNLFRYFIEKSLSKEEALVKEDGNVSLLIPTAFLTEESSSSLRIYCLEHFFLRFAIGFENRMKLFPKVDMRYKFALVQFICSPQKPTQPSQVQFMEYSTDILYNTFEKTLSIFPEDITILSPKNKALFEISHKNDILLLKRIFSEIPLLQESFISFRRELDSAFNKNLFYEEKTEHASIELYRGAMIWQYNSAYAPPQYYLSPSTIDNFLQSREIHRFIHDIYNYIPEKERKYRRYLTKTQSTLNFLQKSKAEILEYIVPERLHWRFAIRAIARNTDERSVIASLLPFGVSYQNSLFTSSSKSYALENDEIIYKKTPLPLILYTISVCNSLTFDWLMRCISAINIGKSHMYKLPFPQPTLANLDSYPYSKLIDNTLALSCAKDPLSYSSLIFEHTRPLIIPSTKEEENVLQIQNDILVARLYNIDKKELSHMLSQKYFAVLWKKKKQYIERLLEEY